VETAVVMTGEDLFWELVEPMYADPAVRRSTMMGLPCVRLAGRFFASLDRRTGALLVKLPADRVTRLIAAGHGEAFAPAGRTFREWVAVPRPDRRRWRGLLAEARAHAGGATRSPDTAEAAVAGFAGFGTAGLEFLAGLARNNTRRFFDAHRDTYRRELLEPSKAFVVALGECLRTRVLPALRAEPRVGGSLFRIANDRRFAPDKAPYKPHLDFAFWEGASGPRRDPSLIVRIAPGEVILGCGVPALTGDALPAYRTALCDETFTAELDRHVTALLADGAELSPPTRRRPPTGVEWHDKAVRFAVRDGFHLTHRLPRPDQVHSSGLVDWCAARLAPFAPVHQSLVRAMR
jgi:uncharacterized protein (TIGR02453 family)